MSSSILILAISVVAGCLGSILGIGGGIILVPALTLGFGIPIHYAVGAGLVSVITTSSASAAVYIRDRLTNLRLAILLEVATTSGAIAGVALSNVLQSRMLFFLFAAILLQSAVSMFRARKVDDFSRSPPIPNSFADRLKLNNVYFDPAVGREISYGIRRVPLGALLMAVSGMISALLGIGSGALKVLAMDRIMGVPLKVSSATSNFMMGVTAAASASAYYFKGDILPEIAAPVAIGVLCGSLVGTQLLARLPARKIRKMFVLVLIAMAIQMIFKGLHYE